MASKISVDSPNRFPAAFQTWHNGGLQKSSTYYSDVFHDGKSEYDSFVDHHHNSNTFAELHICNNEAEYDALISYLFGDE
jgi:hypothetical protein